MVVFYFDTCCFRCHTDVANELKINSVECHIVIFEIYGPVSDDFCCVVRLFEIKYVLIDTSYTNSSS